MNPFWSMSTGSARKRSDGEEKTVTGDLKISPPRTAPKKQLPSIPKNALPITKPTSPAPSAQSTNGTHASYGPFYLEYSLLAEFTLVVKQKLPGVYVQPSYRSALMWFGVIFIRHGLYQDGVFKFTVYIPDNYPDGDCPRLVFDIPVFHPLVDPISGELDVKRAFAKWRLVFSFLLIEYCMKEPWRLKSSHFSFRRNHNHIWQVLMYARRIFYKIDTTTPLNPEAAVLYEKDIQLFKSKVVDSVQLCTTHLFDQPKIEDPYAISFSPWNPSVHDDAREKMLTQKKKPEEQHSKNLHVAGLSWVKPGSVQPFSKEEKTVTT
ncbi:AKT-interacting protein isoform X1 [Sarcophilus harrisii]|uniref:AKT-interacting protein isoform X1 n=1 Tax=Sarcophilus harrisii TaxID=9305 RepID=UPI000C7976B2|nr:AKT-interacting protein isoform X1 [Sarcophilus harrisii]XP_031810372.1 AKT-interacting protein isoform X1 [Sarcophilus harrisii]XP_031810373.1 AKT-interacting protein isoform X1 [Sarcophilus harrisii]